MLPQADLPSLPVQLPISSEHGAATNATSIGVMPSAMSRGRPPWVRNSTGSSIRPAEMLLPMPADM